MSDPVVLLTSVGSKLAMLEAIRSGFQKYNSASKIIAGDTNNSCLGKEFSDDFWLMPAIDDLLINDLLAYCLSQQVTHIIPSRDGDLAFFARYKKILADNNVSVLVSELPGVTNCLDKLAFYEYLGNDFPVIETLSMPDERESSWVVKSRFGAGSQFLHLDLSETNAIETGHGISDAIYQPYIQGQEYSVDVYLDLAGEAIGAVVRSRDHILSGEAVITTSRDKSNIASLAIAVCKKLGLTGHALVQIIEDSQGQLHIIETNCRFGGASILSVALGLDSFYWFALESAGESINDLKLTSYPAGQRLHKYPQQRIEIIE